jgi:hypothetical protein
MEKFKVYHESYMGDEFKVVKGIDHVDAAENYAEDFDMSGDYPLSDGEVEDIVVESMDGARWKFKISAEQTVIYRAREKS